MDNRLVDNDKNLLIYKNKEGNIIVEFNYFQNGNSSTGRQ